MQIPIIDTHVHMDTRSANDYEMMAVTGVEVVIVPATFTGEKRCSKEAYGQYYDRILTHERNRASKFGIKLYAGAAVDPEDMHDRRIAEEAIAMLPEYFKKDGVCAMGEIGLENFTPDEIAVFKQQLIVAKECGMPVIMHTPHENKDTNLPKMLEILSKTIDDHNLDKNRLLLDDLTFETMGMAMQLNLGGYGLAVSPVLNGLFVIHKKATAREAYELIEKFGTDKLMFNTALAWGFGEAMGISRVLLHLKMMGVSEQELKKLAFDNAKRYFSQCPNFKV